MSVKLAGLSIAKKPAHKYLNTIQNGAQTTAQKTINQKLFLELNLVTMKRPNIPYMFLKKLQKDFLTVTAITVAHQKT